MDQLEKLRNDIDQIDSELTVLFEKRMNIVLQLSNLKEKNEYPILDSCREEKLLSKNLSNLNNKDYENELEIFFKCILNISKSIQAKRR